MKTQEYRYVRANTLKELRSLVNGILLQGKGWFVHGGITEVERGYVQVLVRDIEITDIYTNPTEINEVS